ncbi:hypothetical protein IAR55_001503 [Kwoniella newhampshirensis]|uniref:F-box domain-containing protein n=1 Tax=Kwoniella newhampshirensis TaxID=1651941 RepID=A0AAW0Z2B3_9TREE
MITTSPELSPALGQARRRSVASPSPANLLSLPQEILEQLFLLLDLTDRLHLSRTSTILREIHSSSAPLQYLFALETSAYLDVPLLLPPRQPTPPPTISSLHSPPSSPTKPSTSPLAFRSPHTGNIRNSIPSVTLAPWPKEPPEKSPFALPTSAAEKNDALRAREKRWETMDYAEKRTFKVQGREGVYELQEGIFLMCDDFSDQDDEKPSTIRLIPLPSVDDPDLEDPPIPIKATKVPFPIADLTMDPTQDLIVVSEFRPEPSDDARAPPTHRYHLLSMSNFTPHPLAALPSLDFPPFTQAIMQTTQLLQVMGDTLLVLVAKFAPPWVLAGLGLGVGALGNLGHEEEIVAWNWKSGRVLARLSLPENGWFSSVALLTPTTFMLTSTSNISPVLPTEPRSLANIFAPVIQIYSFAPDPTHTIIPVQPLDADHMDDTTPRPVMLVQLELPKFAPGVMLGKFSVRPDPAFPPRKSASDTNPTLTGRKVFTQDPAKGVLVFELKVGEPRDDASPILHDLASKSYELFVLRETLVDLAEQGEERLTKAWKNGGDEDGLGIRGVERIFSWADWGEKGARLMEALMRRRSWVCSCSGYRYISLTPAIRSENHALWPSSEDPDASDPEEDTNEFVVPPQRSDLLLLDFSPFNVRRDQNSEPAPMDFSEYASKDWSVNVIDRDTILDKRRIWREDVKSGLPFRKVRKDYGGWSNGIMIDDQRVIVICTKARRNGDWSTVNQVMTVLCM